MRRLLLLLATASRVNMLLLVWDVDVGWNAAPLVGSAAAVARVRVARVVSSGHDLQGLWLWCTVSISIR